ncbi:MAG: DNA repair protein RecO [Planctomycetota bacterium]
MPPATDQAICVKHAEWSETSQLVTLFCREHGLVRGLAKGSRRERSPFSGGFELLVLGEVVLFEKQGRDLATLAAWDQIDGHAPLRKNLPALWRSLYAVDLVQHALPLRDPHPRSFDHLRELLRGPASPTQHDPVGPDAAALAAFQWSLLDETGQQPDLGHASGHGAVAYFLPADGRLAASPPADAGIAAWPTRAETLAALRSITPSGATDSAADAQTWERAARLLATYWMWLLGRPIPSAPSVFGPLAG